MTSTLPRRPRLSTTRVRGLSGILTRSALRARRTRRQPVEVVTAGRTARLGPPRPPITAPSHDARARAERERRPKGDPQDKLRQRSGSGLRVKTPEQCCAPREPAGPKPRCIDSVRLPTRGQVRERRPLAERGRRERYLLDRDSQPTAEDVEPRKLADSRADPSPRDAERPDRARGEPQSNQHAERCAAPAQRPVHPRHPSQPPACHEA
jgi:hypothetical protein